MKRCPNTLAISLALIAVANSLAQERKSEEVVELETRVVSASTFVRSKEELVLPASELSGDELRRSTQSTLGATLSGEPGVHSSYFGPGSGRPIIRGFDGDRVRILNQGTDSFDVSQTSPDHAVGIEPLFASEIEVVRGPASLLYGNAAIGGVVNVIGKEMPRERSASSLSGQLESSYGSASDEFGAGILMEGGEGNFVWSTGFLERSSGDQEIPGFAESNYQMELEGEEPDEDEAAGTLENSFVDTRSGFLGVAWIGDKESLGVSYSKYDSNYGVPGHSDTHEEEGHDESSDAESEEDVSIDLDQSRLSLRLELLEPNDLFENIEAQFGYGDYRHVELEGEAIGTVFERDGYELRVTGTHKPILNLTGAVGLQIKSDSFVAIGEEAFIPTNDTSSYGVFLVERLNRDWGAWEFGGRIESVETEPIEAERRGRKRATKNASAGFIRSLGEGASVSVNLTYAERAPNASELYAFGPHVGTRSFEIGDDLLGIESSVNLDMSYRRSAGFATGEFTLFFSDFSDYVFMRRFETEDAESLYGPLDTGGLDTLGATASDAEFYGFEFEVRFQLIDEPDRQMHFEMLVDQTRATNQSFDANLPRIPTRRVGGRYEYEFGSWLIGGEGRYHNSASHLAPDELPTDSYFFWGLDVRYRIQATDRASVDLFATGKNLGDAEARPHTSFLKDLVPMPGRSVKLGVRVAF